jgi:hypothetical protein
MRFGRVQGHGRVLESGPDMRLSLVVLLDSGHAPLVVMDAAVPWLEFGPPGDLGWQVDQRTQEAIGTVLAAEGWEAISQDPARSPESDGGLAHSPVYIVRNLNSELAGAEE